MKGLIIHWTDPWKDIFSGVDPMATGYENLVKAHDLELHVLERGWPFSGLCTSRHQNIEDLFSSLDGTICLADVEGEVTSAELPNYDYLFIGPPEGWRNAYPDNPRWTYLLSPNGGYHGLLLAHLAVAITASGD